MNDACPRCSSVEWMTGLRSDSFVYVVSATENRDFFGSGVKGHSDILANLCAECGYTELYAANPRAVWQEWQKRKV